MWTCFCQLQGLRPENCTGPSRAGISQEMRGSGTVKRQYFPFVQRATAEVCWAQNGGADQKQID